jgi:uncharacterized protein (TIGR02001 family)
MIGEIAMRKLLLASAVSTAICLPAAVSAQTAPAAAPAPAAEKSPHTVTANVGFASQYIFRGLTQTNGNPAIQGGADYSHTSGFYAGTWLSNISWFTDQNANTKSAPISLASPGATGFPYAPNQSNTASLEWDFYGGFKNSFAGGDWNYDVGVIQYYYPGTYNNLGAYRKPDTTEIYGLIGYKWVSLKWSKGVSSNTFGVNESKGADYLDLSATVPLGESGVNLLAHVGRYNFPGNANVGYWGVSGCNNNCFDYTDYKLGATKDYWGYTFGLAWTHAGTKDAAPDGQTTAYMNAFGKNIGRDRVALTITKTF